MPPLIPELQHKAVNADISEKDIPLKQTDNLLSISHHPSKTVTFSPYVDIKEVTHINDLSKEEIECLWITDDGMDEIIDRAQQAIDRLKEVESFYDSDDDCARGLESHLSDQQFRRSQEAVYVVLDAQELQWCHGICDTEWIAETYRHLTYECTVEAMEIHSFKSFYTFLST